MSAVATKGQIKMTDVLVQKHLAVQDLTKLKVEELTPLTPEVISRQVRSAASL